MNAVEFDQALDAALKPGADKLYAKVVRALIAQREESLRLYRANERASMEIDRYRRVLAQTKLAEQTLAGQTSEAALQLKLQASVVDRLSTENDALKDEMNRLNFRLAAMEPVSASRVPTRPNVVTTLGIPPLKAK